MSEAKVQSVSEEVLHFLMGSVALAEVAMLDEEFTSDMKEASGSDKLEKPIVPSDWDELSAVYIAWKIGRYPKTWNSRVLCKLQDYVANTESQKERE